MHIAALDQQITVVDDELAALHEATPISQAFHSALADANQTLGDGSVLPSSTTWALSD